METTAGYPSRLCLLSRLVMEARTWLTVPLHPGLRSTPDHRESATRPPWWRNTYGPISEYPTTSKGRRRSGKETTEAMLSLVGDFSLFLSMLYLSIPAEPQKMRKPSPALSQSLPPSYKPPKTATSHSSTKVTQLTTQPCAGPYVF